MHTRILVPLDGSPLSEQVVPYVKLLAKPLGCAVDLLRVIVPVPTELADPAHGRYIDQVAASFADRARQSSDDMKTSLEASGLPVSTVITEGNPGSLIVDEAAKIPEGLIEMSTHGRSGASRTFMGSVTDKVLRSASNPLLLIRSHDPDAEAATVNLANLIVPLDGSSLAEQVLPHVSEVANALSLNVILIRVAPASGEYYSHFAVSPMNGAPGALSEAAEEMSRLAFIEAGEYLEEQKKLLERKGVQSVRLCAVRGRAPDAILDIARETPDSMVAMTTHGRSGIGRWVLGSVAEKVMRHSGTSVLMVRCGRSPVSLMSTK